MKNKLPLLICFGTRPEWLKVKPLIDTMDEKEYRLLFTGQHEDLLNDISVNFKIPIAQLLRCGRLDNVIACSIA